MTLVEQCQEVTEENPVKISMGWGLVEVEDEDGDLVDLPAGTEEIRGVGPRSYKSIAVPPPQVFGLVGPPKKRVNRDKLNR